MTLKNFVGGQWVPQSTEFVSHKAVATINGQEKV